MAAHKRKQKKQTATATTFTGKGKRLVVAFRRVRAALGRFPWVRARFRP